MRASIFRQCFRLSLGALLAGCSVFALGRFRIVNEPTLTLILTLEILGLSVWYGRKEAFVAAIAAGLSMDYLVLPPGGFGSARADRVVLLGAFVLTAVAVGQVASRWRRRETETNAYRDRMEKLHKLGNAMLDSEDSESALDRLPACIAEIFAAPGVALYDHAAGRIFRAGPQAHTIPEDELRRAALEGTRHADSGSGVFIAPIRGIRGPASLGIGAQAFPEELLRDIAERTAVTLARVYAAERTMAAEVARRTDELRSAVLDALMHEIKSPLNALNLAVSALTVAPRHDPRERGMLAAVKHEIDRLNRRIDEALRTAQKEAGEFLLDRHPAFVNRMIRRSLRQMGAVLGNRRIETDFPDTLPPADCDEAMVIHVLKLLLDNAAKYSPPGSPIKVCAIPAHGTVVLSVASRGRPLTEIERQKVFERYYRGREARAAGAPGTGLGLASAKQIVEAHGGAIWVAPEADGNTFQFSLPAVEMVSRAS
jgi:two-component system, OmpR family, sensor histidine kinase KdpD